jgi:hypothetical protein
VHDHVSGTLSGSHPLPHPPSNGTAFEQPDSEPHPCSASLVDGCCTLAPLHCTALPRPAAVGVVERRTSLDLLEGEGEGGEGVGKGGFSKCVGWHRLIVAWLDVALAVKRDSLRPQIGSRVMLAVQWMGGELHGQGADLLLKQAAKAPDQHSSTTTLSRQDCCWWTLGRDVGCHEATGGHQQHRLATTS